MCSIAHWEKYVKFRLPFHSKVGPNPPNCALKDEQLCVEVCFLTGFHWVEGKKE